MAEGTTTRAPRPRKTGLHLDEIVAAAVALSDEQGFDALSMRGVADRLGHGVMSLYRHVRDREQLLALAIDAVFGEEPFPVPAPEYWRGRLRESAWRQWRCYLRHPWIGPAVSLTRPKFGPNGMREMEWAFEGLQELAVPDETRARLYLVVTAFVHGAAGQASAEIEEQRRSGVPATEWWGSQSALLGELFASGEYPLISRLRPDERATPEAWFEFGLECLLDGLADQVGPAVRQGRWRAR